MRTGKILSALVLIIGVAAALPAPSVAADANAMKQVGLTRAGDGNFNLDVEGADIRTVVRAIAEFSGRNIVVSPNVKGTVKVSLHDVGWEEALRTILRMNNLDYVHEGDILRVDDASKLQSEATEREAAHSRQMELVPLETRIIKLNYANAAELQSALQASMSRRGVIQVEKRTNSVILSDLPEIVGKVEKMALELDTTTPQIEITAKLVDVDKEALRDFGIEWNLGGPSQFFTGTIPATAHVPQPGPGQGIASEGKNGIGNPAATLSYGMFQKWGSIEAQLQMMEQNRKANIISNPRITTVDNREAKILVGQKIPLIVQDVAGNPVSQLQTIGIQLRVTPHLTKEKKVIMDLHPEVSDLSTQSTVQGGVIINTSEADTRVMVDDGETAVIGGLIRNNQSHVRRGVPLLKDVPILGALFRSDNTVNQDRELVIFVTPKIVTEMASR